MKEKLTLTIDKSVKDQAKKFARRKGMSVSGMVEQYLKSVSEPDKSWQPRKGSIVSRISGSIPNHSDKNYDELLTDALMEKHGYEKDSD